MAEDVRRFLRHEPILARPASALRKAESWVRRRPWVLAGATTLLVFGLLCVVNFLAQQNAFLRAQQLAPRLVRAPGERLKSLVEWEGMPGMLLSYAAALVLLWRTKHARRVAWRDLWTRENAWRPVHPVPTRVLAVCAFTWLAVTGFAVILLAKLIAAHVWEGGLGSVNLAMTVLMPALSGSLLLNLWQDYRRRRLGLPARALRPDDCAAIRAAVEAFNLPGAFRLYRKAAPESGAAEARDYVMRAADEFRQTQQVKYATASSETLGKVNRRAVALCGALEVVGVAIYCALRPPGDPVCFAYRLVTGFIFGIAMSGAVRVEGFGKRSFIPLIPMFALIAGGDVFFENLKRADHSRIYYTGMLLGMALLTFGHTRWRRAQP